MKRVPFRRILTCLAIAGVAVLVVYKTKLAPVPVLAHKVERGPIMAEVMGTGTLEARVRTTVSARIQERLAEVLVDQGDQVKAGQMLARLDDAESKRQVSIAEATLAAARQTAERVRADLARAEAVLAQARLDHRRMTELTTSRAVSVADAEKAGEVLRVAEAELKRAQAAIGEAEGQIVVAERNLLLREELLAFTEIRAPYDGLIIRRDRDPGAVLVPGSSLLEMVSLDELWISAWVDETAMATLAVGQPARIQFRSRPGHPYPGSVARLGREADRETREFVVDVHVAERPPNWTIGQRAEVHVATGRQADAVLLPTAFLAWREGKAGVFLNEGGVARWRAITLGPANREKVAVTAGLESGQQVVRSPDAGKSPLADGNRIQAP